MGYRQYFVKVENSKIEEIKNLDYKGLVNYCKKNNISLDCDDDDLSEEEKCYYIFFPDILKNLGGKEVFSFGKYYENSDEIYKLGKNLFIDKELVDKFEEESPYVVSKEAVKCAIDWQHKKIVNYFNELLLDDEEYAKKNPFNRKLTREERLENEIKSKLIEWQSQYLTPYNLDNDNKETIINSWLYEYTIFDLVRIYKDTDWNRYSLVFYGY